MRDSLIRNNPSAVVTGVGLTPFSRNAGRSALELQGEAALQALDDAGIRARDVDTVIAGYATTVNHIMPGNLLAEYLGATPERAFGMNVGGATGLAMVAEAARLVWSGSADTVLVVGGENRASGQSRDAAIATLAQVGHATHEVALGANIPAYYALLASEYLHRYSLKREDLAPLAVQMREHARTHPGAQFHKSITVDDVLNAPLIAEPLGLLDCCPISDGSAAFVLSRRSEGTRSVEITGIGETNLHQHVSEADFSSVGARQSAEQALNQAGAVVTDIDIFGIYDSFTITLAILLEEIGIAQPGTAGGMARDGAFAATGKYPLNLHGGLLSYGHPGVAGGMAHMAELVIQIRGEAGSRQLVERPRRGFLHADGGVLSAHVSIVLDGGAYATPSTAEGLK
ncbi:thiolase family protein [Cryobacterium sp. Y50]|uniref:thiolase family protein n=1 Tax=Cryobacterium sp. Y50 TaxID=2048286 RepID=UPI000CE2BC20|nr:thiolase family protein [Cryobacterium sp. Y50]